MLHALPDHARHQESDGRHQPGDPGESYDLIIAVQIGGSAVRFDAEDRGVASAARPGTESVGAVGLEGGDLHHLGGLLAEHLAGLAEAGADADRAIGEHFNLLDAFDATRAPAKSLAIAKTVSGGAAMRVTLLKPAMGTPWNGLR